MKRLHHAGDCVELEICAVSYRGLEDAVRTASPTLVRDMLWTNFLAPVMTGERALAAIKHPLGFVCLPVLREAANGVCVHIWPPTPLAATGSAANVHCHSWHLLSFVLEGTIHNQLCDVVDAASGPYRVCVVNSMGTVDEIVPTSRRVDVKAAEPMACHAGECYEIPAGQFHTSPRLSRDGAVTVVLGHQDSRAVNQTLADPDATLASHVRERLGADETRAIVRTLQVEAYV
jgi:hypothetical protein